MDLSSAAEITSGVLVGADHRFTGISTDSRELATGDLFVAIPGEHFDGHDYLKLALKGGAVGAVVDHVNDAEISQLMVEDTTIALGKLAQSWRARFEIPVLGVTGSNGKTTVTGLISNILSVSHNPLSPKESFNNQWGVPLTLLKLTPQHTHAVIEMGMNHAGEIDYLSRIAAPSIALINNAAAAHLEGLGSVRQVALAKAEIISGVRSDGVVVLNADDSYFDLWKQHAGNRKVISFGLNNMAQVTALDVQINPACSEFDLQIDGLSLRISLPLAGRHNIMNALAAAATCIAAGIDPKEIVSGLESAKGKAGRLLTLETESGAVLIDDSFNANPSSSKAAIEVLANYSGKRILVLGAMAELGPEGEAMHAEVGKAAATAGIDRLIVLADSGNSDIQGLLRGYGEKAECFDDIDALLESVQVDDKPGVSLLVKGSKSSRMGRVVELLVGSKNDIKSSEALC